MYAKREAIDDDMLMQREKSLNLWRDVCILISCSTLVELEMGATKRQLYHVKH